MQLFATFVKNDTQDKLNVVLRSFIKLSYLIECLACSFSIFEYSPVYDKCRDMNSHHYNDILSTVYDIFTCIMIKLMSLLLVSIV